MSRLTWSLGLLMLLCLAELAAAGDILGGSKCRQRQCNCGVCSVYCCPDTYCPKPLPCIPCLALPPSCECYCPKPLPCIPCACVPQRCDDYCRKPIPQICCPVPNQFYRCPPCDNELLAPSQPTGKTASRRADQSR